MEDLLDGVKTQNVDFTPIGIHLHSDKGDVAVS